MSTHAPTGKLAITEYRVQESFDDFSLLKVVIHTGRTHQIRVHLAHIGYPVVGDAVYGGGRKRALEAAGRRKDPQLAQTLESLRGQALHAGALTFTHPHSGELLCIEAPLPDDMQQLFTLLRTATP
jgi:23S rRNA pseudouridine1911/1915/1917 synthase